MQAQYEIICEIYNFAEKKDICYKVTHITRVTET